MHSSANRNRGFIFKTNAWDSVFYTHFKTRAKVRKYTTTARALSIVNYFEENMIKIRII